VIEGGDMVNSTYYMYYSEGETEAIATSNGTEENGKNMVFLHSIPTSQGQSGAPYIEGYGEEDE